MRGESNPEVCVIALGYIGLILESTSQVGTTGPCATGSLRYAPISRCPD